jgi:hypothetical protein
MFEGIVVATETTVSPGILIMTLPVGFDASTLVMYACNVGVSALTDIENAPKSMTAASKNAAIFVFIIATPYYNNAAGAGGHINQIV